LSRPKVFKSLIAVSFVVTLLSLGVRSLVAQDTRFGWGMFSHQTSFVITYDWVFPDGSHKQILDTRTDLPGRQSIISGGRFHTTRYGVGAVRLWVNSYLIYLYERRLPETATSVQANFTFLIDREKAELETWRYPPIEG